MKQINIEIKAKSENTEKIRNVLNSLSADYRGKDHQIDIYYQTKNGRLKLRKGNIENKLIYYNRENTKGLKRSEVLLMDNNQDSNLEKILESSIGIKVVVDKKREIYFINNVRFHIDEVKELGNFIEIEAIRKEGEKSDEELTKQCTYYKDLFQIKDEDLIKYSYSDMILEKENAKLE
ncbi:MAG: class IV adenylate cyclase [Nanoarchaeota archaeon]|nr:class IV adenylate cyclase [Nanoarchaeota archaeon]